VLLSVLYLLYKVRFEFSGVLIQCFMSFGGLEGNLQVLFANFRRRKIIWRVPLHCLSSRSDDIMALLDLKIC